MTNDNELHLQIEDALKEHRLFRTPDIRIDVRDGHVTLYGMVDVLAEKDKAGEIVSRIHGVKALDNSLTVVMDNPVSDSEITESLLQRLARDPREEVRKVGASTKGGKVFLMGEVADLASRMFAEEVARGVPGVREVENQVKVAQPERGDDATLTNEVERALAASLLVSSRDIFTATKDGVVTLDGEVDTEDQIKAAEKIAATVSGVSRIINKLTSRHGYNDRDNYLTNQLRSVLGEHGLGGVKAFVVGRTAFLEGAVVSPDQKHRAQELASQVEGLAGVHNDIIIQAH